MARAQCEEDKFIVINKKHLDKMPWGLRRRLILTLEEVIENLPGHKYYVCNQDEPYAQKVINTILAGESEKLQESE